MHSAHETYMSALIKSVIIIHCCYDSEIRCLKCSIMSFMKLQTKMHTLFCGHKFNIVLIFLIFLNSPF